MNTTSDDILDLSQRDLTFRELAAIHIHAGVVANSGMSYLNAPNNAAELTIRHVNALAAELARTDSSS